MGKNDTKQAGTTSGTVTADNFNAENFGKQLGGAANTAFNAGPKVFDKSLYAGMGPQTNAGLDSLFNTASASQGMFGTPDNIKATAAGDYLGGSNPYFEANLAKAKDSTYADVMASLGGTGRTGSNIHMDELTGALGNLDNTARGQQYETERDRQVQALGMMPGLYQNSLLPGQTMLQAGQIRDADGQAKLMADYDLFQRQDPFSHVSKYMSLMNGAQGTQGVAAKEPETPWWQSAIGGAIGVGSMFL